MSHLNHFFPSASYTLPFSRAPLRGQSAPPPPAFEKGLGRQLIPVQEPQDTWQSYTTLVSTGSGKEELDMVQLLWACKHEPVRPIDLSYSIPPKDVIQSDFRSVGQHQPTYSLERHQ